MSLKRYDSVGWEEMDESPTGEFVRLEEVIKLLENHKQEQIADDTGRIAPYYHVDTCGLCKDFSDLDIAITLIKGEQNG